MRLVVVVWSVLALACCAKPEAHAPCGPERTEPTWPADKDLGPPPLGAVVLGPNATASGTLMTGQVDTYAVQLQAREFIKATVVGPTGDARIRIRVLAPGADTNYGGAEVIGIADANLPFGGAGAGWYLLQVDPTPWATWTGPYELSLGELAQDDQPGTLEDGVTLQAPATFTARFDFPGDADVAALPVLGGIAYLVSGGAFEVLRPDGHTRAGGVVRRPSDECLAVSARSEVHVEELGPDDHGDSEDDATSLALPIDAKVHFDRDGDNDVISFEQEPGHTYEVKCGSSDAPCRISIGKPYDAPQSSVRGVGQRSFTASTGTAFIYFSAAEAQPLQTPCRDCRVEITEGNPDDHPYTSPTEVLPGAVVKGRIDTADDLDYFTSPVTPQGIYRLECVGCFIRMFGYPWASRLIGNTETIVLKSQSDRLSYWTSGSPGDSYSLRLVDAGPDDCASDFSTACALSAGQAISGRNQYTEDVDAVSFSTTSQVNYDLTCDSTNNTVTMTFNATTRNIGPNYPVTFSFSGGAQWMVQLQILPPTGRGSEALWQTADWSCTLTQK